MSNKEILEKATDKAVRGGWKDPYKGETLDIRKKLIWLNWRTYVFDHQFAKALWGEDTDTGYERECKTCLCDTVWYLPTWQYHLQQMVVASDPIKYLGENL